ncbi:DinB family protein [Paenibacillus sinopodophylli]|uniref:DinB family protein n=1 Tax=Paenibacillus sinopodophylli TaxID=1837342 RepID=UPI00110CA4C4|nr:DinB family protein [Paenibacillus sinopodophylli]
MQTIQKMYEHLHWANQRILETLQNIDVESQQVRLFSHILNAERVWIARLREKDSSHLPIWSDGDLQECTKLVKQNEEDFRNLLTELEKIDIDKLVSYSNSKGIAFKTSIRDILVHVALHGQYHRGQINSRIRANGFEPVGLDYIIFAR